MSKETVYSDNPVEVAIRWYEEGAERIHIVDLDGAVGGRPVNHRLVEEIARSVPVPIQLGGGIRDLETMETCFQSGVEQVILGTLAIRHPDIVDLACRRFPGRIIVGIDARNDRVAIEGWTEETGFTPLDLAKKFEQSGIAAIIYTDIHRDGMETGPNVENTEKLAKALNIPVIASGGISGLDDVKKILKLHEIGVTGVITGKALYDGNLDLAQAIALVKSTKCN